MLSWNFTQSSRIFLTLNNFKLFSHLVWIEFHSSMDRREILAQMRTDGNLGDEFCFVVLYIENSYHFS